MNKVALDVQIPLDKPLPPRYEKGQVIEESSVRDSISDCCVILDDGYEAMVEPVNDSRLRITDLWYAHRGID